MTQNQTLDITAASTLLTQYQQTFDTFADRLIEENKHTNLTRITDTQQVRDRHFLDSLAAIPVLNKALQNNASPTIADIGSGAGFPVLPLAIVRPSWKFVSIEATGKKTDFQKKAAAQLELKNITVIHGRAEDLAHKAVYREQFDIALARAVADMRVLAELTLPFVKVGGQMLAFKSAASQNELDGAVKTIAALGGRLDMIYRYALPATGDDFCIVAVTKTTAAPNDFPRSYALIAKKPAV